MKSKFTRTGNTNETSVNHREREEGKGIAFSILNKIILNFSHSIHTIKHHYGNFLTQSLTQ